MVYLRSQSFINKTVANLPEVADATYGKAKQGAQRTRARLAAARASTVHFKIVGPAHLTTVGVERDYPDAEFYLEAPNAMAIEYGHNPSGVFGPGGRFGHLITKAPDGLFILTRAAGLM